jgi:hypothetical protein
MTSNNQTQQQNLPKFAPGALVNVKGYGGAAKVIKAVDDGVTPQGHTKWLYTVEFGPFSPNPYNITRANGVTSRNAVGRTLKFAQGRYHDFYQSRLKPYGEPETNGHADGSTGHHNGHHNTNDKPVADMTRDEIIAALRELNIPFQA